jgi:hypothetical protein
MRAISEPQDRGRSGAHFRTTGERYEKLSSTYSLVRHVGRIDIRRNAMDHGSLFARSQGEAEERSSIERSPGLGSGAVQ